MDRVDEHDLVGAYVLDALPAAERESFEHHLSSCPACREEVAVLSQVVDVLPLAVQPVEPPAGLWDRIASEVAPQPISLSERRRRLPLALSLVAAAAVFVALGLWNLQLRSNLDRQSTQVAALQAIAHHARLVPLPGTAAAPDASAYVVQPVGNKRAYLIVAGLPPAANKVYQLWLVHGAVPRSAGVFTGSDSGVTVIPLSTSVSGYQVAAVTVEPGPHGSPGPTGPQVLMGKLST